MKRTLKGWLVVIEWLILIVMSLMIAMMVIPYSDMYDFGKIVRDAKEDHIYFEGIEEKQEYFGRSLEVEGIIYDKSELSVLVKACHFGQHGKLPMHAYLRTVEGEEIGMSGSGSTSTIFCAKGYFTYEDVPIGLKQVEFTNEAYGQSFSFILDLNKEGDE